MTIHNPSDITRHSVNPTDSVPIPETRSRPPGVALPFSGVAALVVGMVGLTADATLALPVMELAFGVPFWPSVFILTVVAIGAADLAIVAGERWTSGKRFAAGVLLLLALLIGVAMAWARTVHGIAPEADAPMIETALSVGEEAVHDEGPATLLMLGIYCASVASVFAASIKVLHPARKQLKHHQREMERSSETLALFEADLVAVQERIRRQEEHEEQLHRDHACAVEQLIAREAQLKAYARDAIARAVGDPAATPLVRAPHEPKPTDQLNRLHPVN